MPSTAVSLSTCEAENYAVTYACKEVIWQKRVLKKAGLGRMKEAVPVLSDNIAAVNWAVGEKCPSGRAKHIDVRVHFIRELVKKSVICVNYVPSEDNDADMLTKPLGPVKLKEIIGRIGLGGEIEEEC